MKVVEKDRVINGMLSDEFNRCREMLNSLKKSASVMPKGVLNKRKKKYKGKVYFYQSLKYRDGNKVINRHISADEGPELSKRLEQRKKIIKEMQVYKKKIAYLSKILKIANRE